MTEKSKRVLRVVVPLVPVGLYLFGIPVVWAAVTAADHGGGFFGTGFDLLMLYLLFSPLILCLTALLWWLMRFRRARAGVVIIGRLGAAGVVMFAVGTVSGRVAWLARGVEVCYLAVVPGLILAMLFLMGAVSLAGWLKAKKKARDRELADMMNDMVSGGSNDKAAVQAEIVRKPSFAVIGKEGSTTDGEGFIKALWDDANGRFAEVEPSAKKDASGRLAGVWGLMSDFSRSFLPWEDVYSKGLYLAGVEVRDDAEPPAGWVKWVVPAFTYVRVRHTGPTTFRDGLAYLAANGHFLVGAVQEYTDPADGAEYLYFPIRKE